MRAVCVFELPISDGYGVFVYRFVEHGFDYEVACDAFFKVIRLTARVPTFKRIGVLRGCGFDGICGFRDLFAVFDFIRVHAHHGYAVTAAVVDDDGHRCRFLAFRYGDHRFAFFDGCDLSARYGCYRLIGRRPFYITGYTGNGKIVR